MRARGRLTRPRRGVVGTGKKNFSYAEAPPAPELHATPEQCLWIAVIERALADVRGSSMTLEAGIAPRLAERARRWLLEEPEFLLVADYAGVENPQALREVIAHWLATPIQVTGYGPTVRQLIARAGVSQRDLGKALELSQGCVSTLVSGRKLPGPEVLARTIAFFRTCGLDTKGLEALLGRRATILTGPVDLPLAA